MWPTASAPTRSVSSNGPNASGASARGRRRARRSSYPRIRTAPGGICGRRAHGARGERCLNAMMAAPSPRVRRADGFADAPPDLSVARCCRLRRSSAPVGGVGLAARIASARAVARAGIHAHHSRRPRPRSRTSCSTLRDPHRLVLDLDGVELTRELAQLPSRRCTRRIRTSPAIRIGQKGHATRCASCSTSRRGRAAALRAGAGRRVRPSRHSRPLSADTGRSADGAADESRRAASARSASASDRAPAATSARSESARTRSEGRGPRADHHRDRSRATAARTPARSGRAAPTRRTSRSRSRRKLKAHDRRRVATCARC